MLIFFHYDYFEVLREVATLSRLQHQHVVRYYQVRFYAMSLFLLDLKHFCPKLLDLEYIFFVSNMNTELMKYEYRTYIIPVLIRFWKKMIKRFHALKIHFRLLSTSLANLPF